MESVFLMVVLIVLISCAAGVAQKYIKLRQQQLDTKPGNDLQEELQDIKNRIAVLEKIVTDRKFNLSEEIADLERQ